MKAPVDLVVLTTFIVLVQSLLVCKGLLTDIASGQSVMGWCVAMFVHRLLAAELLLAFGVHVNTAESCIVSAGVKSQRISRIESCRSNWGIGSPLRQVSYVSRD